MAMPTNPLRLLAVALAAAVIPASAAHAADYAAAAAQFLQVACGSFRLVRSARTDDHVLAGQHPAPGESESEIAGAA